MWRLRDSPTISHRPWNDDGTNVFGALWVSHLSRQRADGNAMRTAGRREPGPTPLARCVESVVATFTARNRPGRPSNPTLHTPWLHSSSTYCDPKPNCSLLATRAPLPSAAPT